MMRVGFEVEVARPAPFQAVTLTRMRWPTSFPVTVYSAPPGSWMQKPFEHCTPLTETHALFLAEQRSHWSLNMYGERVHRASVS